MAGRKVALVLGASGETGKEVVRQLVGSDGYSQVNIVTRRQLDFPKDEPGYNKISQKIVDFDQLEQSSSAFAGVDAAFCCLGTTRAAAGAEGFVKVDHDYVLHSAKILHTNNCSDFHLLTSKGSNKDSWFLYPSTKGKVEAAVADVGFPRLTIYRPGLLLCERPNRPRRMFEEFAQKVAGWIDKSHGWSVPTNILAAAMVSNAPNPDSAKTIRGLDLPVFDGKGLRIGIVSARWNSVVTDALVDGCVEAMKSCGVTDITIERVAGSYEIPQGAQALLETHRYDGVVCIGCLIKGESMHFEYISEAVTQGIMQLNLMYKKPVIYGILGCLNEEQAKERAGVGSGHNSGKDWGITCVESCLLTQRCAMSRL